MLRATPRCVGSTPRPAIACTSSASISTPPANACALTATTNTQRQCAGAKYSTTPAHGQRRERGQHDGNHPALQGIKARRVPRPRRAPPCAIAQEGTQPDDIRAPPLAQLPQQHARASVTDHEDQRGQADEAQAQQVVAHARRRVPAKPRHPAGRQHLAERQPRGQQQRDREHGGTVEQARGQRVPQHPRGRALRHSRTMKATRLGGPSARWLGPAISTAITCMPGESFSE